MTTYRSELYIPINQDKRTFADRQKSLFGDVDSRMEQRRREWEEEVDRMRKDFFRLRPRLSRSSSEDSLESNRKLFVEDPRSGEPQFKIQFDCSEFKANEINVSTKDQKLAVSARHEEITGNASKIREFSRKVDIPENVDPESLICNLSSDGILCVEAPVNCPSYGGPISPASSTGSGSHRNEQQVTRTSQSSLLSSAPLLSNVDTGHRSEKVSTTRTSQMTSTMSGTRGVQTGPIITNPDGTRKLQLEFEVKDYKPEEIEVKTEGNRLVIHALHEEKTGGRSIRRELNKEYDLPVNVDPLTLNAYVSQDSKLQIQAPLKETKPVAVTKLPSTASSAIKYAVPVRHY